VLIIGTRGLGRDNELHAVGSIARPGRHRPCRLRDDRTASGSATYPGGSGIEQFRDGRLSFGSDLGVAAEPSFDSLPASYLEAEYVHLGSAPLDQQRAWLGFLRAQGYRTQISVDMFESFVAAEPQACRELCARADLIFVNEAEYRGLFDGRPHPLVPVIRKYVAGPAVAGELERVRAKLGSRGPPGPA